MAIIGGSRGGDSIRGTVGNDIILSGAGRDSIDSGGGNDLIDAGAGNDVVDAGIGNDRVFGGSGDDTVAAGEGNDSIFSGSGNDAIDDTGGDNLIFGGAGHDRFSLGSGRTVLFGDAGDDTVTLGTGAVTADLGSGDDRAVYDATLPGRHEPAQLSGAAGTDVLELRLTAAQARDASVQADLARFAGFLATGSNAPFTFATLDLRASDFERLVTTVKADAVVAVADEARTTEDEAVTVAVLANDTGAGLRVVAVSGDGASIGGGGTSVRFDPGDRYQGLAAGAEEQVALEYTVRDSAGTEARATLTVTVAGLNDRPTALALDDATVAENAAGAVIGTLSVTDPDAGDTFTYSVDDDRLEVVEGRLKLKDGESFDYERGFLLPVSVTATDAGGASISEGFEIVVADVNDAPDAGLDQTLRYAEDTAAGTVLTEILGSDQDEGSTVTYSLTGGNGLGLFVIDATTGEISLAAGKALDYESVALHELTVTVSDGTLSDTMRVTVEVTDVQSGPIDLVSANGIANTVSVRLNDGDGGFTGTGSVAVGFQPLDVALGDLDGDRDLDLVTADSDGKASVRLNDGAGAFSGTGGASVPDAIAALALGDLDGDGDLDLVTANRDTALGPDRASVRLNDGQGRFSGSQEVAVGDQARAVALGDLDGDGDLDFVTADYADDAVSVRLNDGDGVFSGSGSGSIGVSEGPTTLALGDLDGDGDLDLVKGYAQASKATVHLNDGDGTFTSAGSTLVGACFHLALGDLDDDGDLDLVAASFGSNAVAVRLNDGDGAFSGDRYVAVGSGPTWVALGDLDDDRDLDFVTANSGGASLRFNDGTGAFSGTGSLAVASSPIAVALGELNGAEAATASGLPDLGGLLPNAAELDYLI